MKRPAISPSKANRWRRRRRRRRRAPVRIFRATVASFHYDQQEHHLTEYEAHYKLARGTRTRADIKRIRKQLELKAARNFRYWLFRHLNVSLDREVRVNFEHEERAQKQIVQTHASVRRFVMRRVGRRWEAEELPSSRIRFGRRRKRAKK